MISERTRAALQAAKARGASLGGFRGGPKVDGKLGAQANREAAEAFAAAVGPMVQELRQQGLSLRQIAAELAERGFRTSRGGAWSAEAVRSVLARVPSQT